MKKFKIQNFKYNLSRDIIHSDDEMVSLKHHSMIIYIGNLFKILLNDPARWNENLSMAKTLTPFLHEEWSSIEKLVYEIFFSNFKSILCDTKFAYCVQKTVHFIGTQILDFLFKKPWFSPVTVSIFFKNIVFTSQGTINTKKTIFRALEDFHKMYYEEFQIMCSYFLGIGFIKRFYKSLPMKKKKRIDRVQNDYKISFWMTEINISCHSVQQRFPREYHISECLPPSISDSDAYMFFEAIIKNNEIGVEYLWINKISEMVEREQILERALNMIVEDSTKINIIMFLLFQVNENELSDFFKSKSITVIQNIVKKVRWHCVLLKFFRVSQTYFNKEDLTQIFGALIDSHCEDNLSGLHLDTAVEYFTLLTDDEKIHITRGFTTDSTDSNLSSPQLTQNYYERTLRNAVLNSREDLLLELLSIGSAEIKNFFSSKSGITSLTEAAKEGSLNLIYKVLSDFITESVADIMFNFFNESKNYLCRYFIQKVRFDELKTFVDLCSGLEENRVKREILYMFGGNLLRETLFPKDKMSDFENLRRADDILFWCLKSDEGVSSFKRSMNLSSDIYTIGDIAYYDKMRTCVVNQQFGFLTSFFLWKGIEPQEKEELLRSLTNDSLILTYILNIDDITTFFKIYENFLRDHNAFDENDVESLKQRS